MKKYLVIPGWITSKSDGDRHYISANKLIRLYGVDRRECVVFQDGERGFCDSLIKLEPDYNGDYNINQIVNG